MNRDPVLMGNVAADAVVVGGGLAGSEAAWQLAQRGVRVALYEMRPQTMTPAHHTGSLAELVCSNSMKSTELPSAPAILKAELERLGSKILATARETRIPAGTALAVDREAFSDGVTMAIESHDRIEVVREERADLDEDRPVIVATGPLTSPAMEETVGKLAGGDSLYFFDAAAPLVEADTIDMTRAFAASRYGKGNGDYVNCPMSEDEYRAFREGLISAERVIAKDFEERELFSACQPVEEIAQRGVDALRYGPMKPVGLIDPGTGNRPYAVVQLRQDNAAGTLYNIVGFQTNLKWPEQKRLFRTIPGLAGAEFARYGVMHRNTYLDAPRVLTRTLAAKSQPRVHFAGQITGSEGYLEAAATGIVAALNVFAVLERLEEVVLPATTAIGSLVEYLAGGARAAFQPQHANLGLLPPLAERVRGKRQRHEALAQRALSDLDDYLNNRPELRIEDSRGSA